MTSRESDIMSAFTPVRWDDEAAWLLGWRGGMRLRSLAPLGGERRRTNRYKMRTDGEMASESFSLTSFLDVCRHFGGLLRRFCQCISFSWFLCVPSLSCVYSGWPQRRPAKCSLRSYWVLYLCWPCQTKQTHKLLVTTVQPWSLFEGQHFALIVIWWRTLPTV